MLFGRGRRAAASPKFFGGRKQRSKRFFFAKKNQKTFVYNAFSPGPRARQLAKVLASFLKRRASLLLAGQLQGHLA
jgi:hypothetical protein